MGIRWSEITVWTSWCPSANQNATAVLIIVFPVNRASARAACFMTFLWQLPKTEHVFCPAVVLTARRSVKLTNLKSGRWCFVVVIHRSNWLFCKLGTNCLKFHPETDALTVAVTRTNIGNDCKVKDYYWACVCY